MALPQGSVSKAFSDLAKLRWARIPPDERADHVPRNGGRPRSYPPCPNYKNRAHRFTRNRCPCGYIRDETAALKIAG